MQKILKFVIVSVVTICVTTYIVSQIVLKTFKIFYPFDPIFAFSLWSIVVVYFSLACSVAIIIWNLKRIKK
jgi:hypothetical protein